MKQIEWKHLYETNFEHVRRCVLHPHTESRVLLRSKPLIVLQLRSKLLEVYVVKPAGTWPNPDRHGAEYTPAWPVSWRRFRNQVLGDMGFIPICLFTIGTKTIDHWLPKRRKFQGTWKPSRLHDKAQQHGQQFHVAQTHLTSFTVAPFDFLFHILFGVVEATMNLHMLQPRVRFNDRLDAFHTWAISESMTQSDPIAMSRSSKCLEQSHLGTLCPLCGTKRKCVGSIRTPGFWLPPDLRPAGPIPPNTKDCWFVSNVKSATKDRKVAGSAGERNLHLWSGRECWCGQHCKCLNPWCKHSQVALPSKPAHWLRNQLWASHVPLPCTGERFSNATFPADALLEFHFPPSSAMPHHQCESAHTAWPISCGCAPHPSDHATHTAKLPSENLVGLLQTTTLWCSRLCTPLSRAMYMYRHGWNLWLHLLWWCPKQRWSATSVWYTELPRTLMEMATSNSDVRKGIIRLSNQLKLVGAAVSKSPFNKY